MRPDDEIRLRHLMEAASKAMTYPQADFGSDVLFRLVVTTLVEIGGETAKHIRPKLRAGDHRGGHASPASRADYPVIRVAGVVII